MIRPHPLPPRKKFLPMCSKFRRICFLAHPVPDHLPFRSLRSRTGPVIFSRISDRFPERTGTGPVPVHTGPILVFLYKTGIGPDFKKRTGIRLVFKGLEDRSWTDISYRSNTGLYWVQYRSITTVFDQYFLGLFRTVPYWSSYQSPYFSGPVRTGPLYQKTQTADLWCQRRGLYQLCLGCFSS